MKKNREIKIVFEPMIWLDRDARSGSIKGDADVGDILEVVATDEHGITLKLVHAAPQSTPEPPPLGISVSDGIGTSDRVGG